MKNVSKKIIGAVGVLGLAGAVYAFTSEDNTQEPEYNKYEVVRMVNGELTEFDTLIPVNSDYSANDYLEDLGFSEDKNISIINLSDFQAHEMEFQHFGEEGMDGKHIIKMEVNEEVSVDTDGEGDEDVRVIIKHGDGETVHEDGDEEMKAIVKEFKNEDGENVFIEGGEDGENIRIEKHITKTENGEEVEIDVNAFLEEMNLDSLISEAIKGVEGEDGEHKVIMKKVIMTEDGEMPEGFEWHEMDTEGADFHKEIHGDGSHMQFAVWGDEAEDFTLVIVSPADESGKRAPVTEVEDSHVDFKLFPNPVTTTANLQLNIRKKAKSTITITDVNGRVVEKYDLGAFSGNYNKEINVKNWSKGVYFVHVESGNEKMIEKLIVE